MLQLDHTYKKLITHFYASYNIATIILWHQKVCDVFDVFYHEDEINGDANKNNAVSYRINNNYTIANRSFE